MCHSSKEAETRNLVKLLDETLYQANIVEQVLYNKKRKLEIKLFTDNKPLLDSIASSKQVENKMMREVIADMKEKLVEKKVSSYEWIETKKIVADILTKEKMDTVDMYDIVMAYYISHWNTSYILLILPDS